MDKRHYWLIAYNFKEGSGYVYADTEQQYITPCAIDWAIKQAISKEKFIEKADPVCVSYLGHMTKEESESF